MITTKTGIRIGCRYERPVRVTREEELTQRLLLTRNESKPRTLLQRLAGLLRRT